MAFANEQFPGDGVTSAFPINFPYISREHITVSVDGAVPDSVEFLNPQLVFVSPTPDEGTVVDVRRATPADKAVTDFKDGSTLAELELDAQTAQLLFIVQEAYDGLTTSIALGPGGWDALGSRITDVLPGTASTDAVTVGQLAPFATAAESAKTAAEAASAQAQSSEADAEDAATRAVSAAASAEQSLAFTELPESPSGGDFIRRNGANTGYIPRDAAQVREDLDVPHLSGPSVFTGPISLGVAEAAITPSSGTLQPVASFHTISVDSAGGSVSSISTASVPDGAVVVFQLAPGSGPVTLEHALGSIVSADLKDITLATAGQSVTLRRNGSAWEELSRNAPSYPAGTLVQTKFAELVGTSDFAQSAPIMDIDGTIPQITEGEEVFSVTFTPRFANSKIRIRFNGVITQSVNGSLQRQIVMAVFQDGGADAVAVTLPAEIDRSNTVSTTLHASPEFLLDAGNTDERTYSVRVGWEAIVTTQAVRLNGVRGFTEPFGANAMKTLLTIEEIAQ